MSKVMGKKKAFLVVSRHFNNWLHFTYGSFLFQENHTCSYLRFHFFHFGIGSLFTLMMSMTSDVIDIDELNTGKRREGIFGAIYWWMVKFGSAIAGLLSGLIITLVAFKSELQLKQMNLCCG